ncbi:DUF3027 domain-containing protein [Segniliparus rugosus]|uniref:DUF3027 domain-containing protein n=1 Tax=Segniliparus rugosus (strain ATCC BAA-974 / DSM 45345 / CCUG 50838 / CIP 108380 / JCM 13579 / CDC 945) TaxID=679197 RepID=E5XVI2_SEGRC|nr:DUF3027 domain-containing protein [Segniliparus rugosus]EFV11642.2 hypothetical protein HMPREF9336_03504 [Segniliparus rugosus ATCC BAA-974]
MLITMVDAPADEELLARLEQAVDLAADALREQFGDGDSPVVGAHLGSAREGSTSVTHLFASLLPGYRGWRWSAVLAGCPGQDEITVSEVALLPGPDALIAPEWVPWERRVQAGDLGVGDLLPTPADDRRLVPAHASSGDEDLDELMSLVDIGRSKTLSIMGRAQAAQRWHDGLFGPSAPMAVVAPKRCAQCGFFIPLEGSLSASFGVCANEYSADGRVVDANYGCGAHSDVVVESDLSIPQKAQVAEGVAELVEGIEVLEAPAAEGVAEDAAEPGEGVEVLEAPAAEGVAEDAAEPGEGVEVLEAPAAEGVAEDAAEPGEGVEAE